MVTTMYEIMIEQLTAVFEDQRNWMQVEYGRV